MSEKRHVSEPSLFENEEEVQRHSRQVIASPPADYGDLLEEYRLLEGQFSRLLKNTARLTRLGDGHQRKLMRLKNQLEEKNRLVNAQKEQLQDMNRKLELTSLTDSLTGLHNRRYLDGFLKKDVEGIIRLHESEQAGRDLLFLILDIDHFKLINDTYGHAAGDEVLIQFSRLLERNCRKGDIPVRWGGEEFLIVCRDSDRRFGIGLAERVRKQVEENAFIVENDREINCTVSIGFSFFPLFPKSARGVDLGGSG